MSILLTRDVFRNSVFERDKHLCVICKESAIDAHHILERRLFADGGYYINNGASLCEKHHLLAESTQLSCDEIRQAAGITEIVIPLHFYTDVEYDKWGNEILANGTRVRGELFNDPSVQKILENVLDTFTDRVKYPRTFHLPWSPGVNRDDRTMEDISVFENQEVIICEKLDGENCLDGNTIIVTEDGPKTIKWICDTKYSGKVLSYNVDTEEKEFQKIINWQTLENNKDWYQIEIETGETLILTSNHYVYLPELKCYRQVKDLKEDDEILLNEKSL
jgi:hypothetical protein